MNLTMNIGAPGPFFGGLPISEDLGPINPATHFLALLEKGQPPRELAWRPTAEHKNGYPSWITFRGVATSQFFSLDLTPRQLDMPEPFPWNEVAGQSIIDFLQLKVQYQHPQRAGRSYLEPGAIRHARSEWLHHLGRSDSFTWPLYDLESGRELLWVWVHHECIGLEHHYLQMQLMNSFRGEKKNGTFWISRLECQGKTLRSDDGNPFPLSDGMSIHSAWTLGGPWHPALPTAPAALEGWDFETPGVLHASGFPVELSDPMTFSCFAPGPEPHSKMQRTERAAVRHQKYLYTRQTGAARRGWTDWHKFLSFAGDRQQALARLRQLVYSEVERPVQRAYRVDGGIAQFLFNPQHSDRYESGQVNMNLTVYPNPAPDYERMMKVDNRKASDDPSGHKPIYGMDKEHLHLAYLPEWAAYSGCPFALDALLGRAECALSIPDAHGIEPRSSERVGACLMNLFRIAHAFDPSIGYLQQANDIAARTLTQAGYVWDQDVKDWVRFHGGQVLASWGKLDDKIKPWMGGLEITAFVLLAKAVSRNLGEIKAPISARRLLEVLSATLSFYLFNPEIHKEEIGIAYEYDIDTRKANGWGWNSSKTWLAPGIFAVLREDLLFDGPLTHGLERLGQRLLNGHFRDQDDDSFRNPWMSFGWNYMSTRAADGASRPQSPPVLSQRPHVELAGEPSPAPSDEDRPGPPRES